MKRPIKIAVATSALLLTQACISTSLGLTNADGKNVFVMYYPGGEVLPDLLVIDGVNHYGKAQYQIDDPLADIGFRFEIGKRVRAECVEAGKDILGLEQCRRYKVFWSDFEKFPVGTIIPNPAL